MNVRVCSGSLRYSVAPSVEDSVRLGVEWRIFVI